jgi:uncharacterized integral membrane protein (TIGR00697 family)
VSTDPEAPEAPASASSTVGRRSYKHYDLVLGAFVAVLLCSNLIGTSKVVSIDGRVFGAGILFFPLSYVFGDVLTEVYGYARSRRVVWAGFVAMLFAAVMSYVVVTLPPAPDWDGQAHLAAVFGQTPRIALASLCGYFSGEFANSYVLAKMKIATRGKHLWARTIGSTIAGEAVDSVVFYPLAFGGVWPTSLVLKVMLSNYLLKVTLEAVLTPVTYRVVAWLKREEHEDFYDTDTDFTPFSLKA